MKKKTRKAIVISIVYLIITWIFTLIIAENAQGFRSDDWFLIWLVLLIPVAFYWAKRFISAGED